MEDFFSDFCEIAVSESVSCRQIFVIMIRKNVMMQDQSQREIQWFLY
jgi:hypothetical protein